LGISTYHGAQFAADTQDNIKRWGAAVDAKYNKKGNMLSRQDFDEILGEYMVSKKQPWVAWTNLGDMADCTAGRG
jgi:hypothetical protein